MFTLLNIFFGIISFTFICLYYFFTKNFNYWKIRNVPGPKPVPLFGNIKDSALRKENAAVTMRKCYEMFPDEPVVGIYRMTSPWLLIRDLDIIKHVMVKDFEIFEERGVEFSKEGIGANIFHADATLWRALRYKFTPLFTTAKLKGMLHLIVERCDEFMIELEQYVKNQSEQEVYNIVKTYTIYAIMVCAFGLKMNAKSVTLMKKLSELDELTLKANLFHEVDMMFPGIFKNFSSALFPKELLKFFEKLVSDCIENRNGIPSNRNDLIDLILEMKQQGNLTLRQEHKKTDHDNFSVNMSTSFIAAQAIGFYVGGYETSATILSFMLYELALQPDIQDKVIKEVDDVLKKHNGQITYETLSDLNYIEKVFNETYRKYPIIPLQRKANADYKVPGTKLTIEKGTMIIVPTLGIHYDEKYYPNPNKFDPERFSVENLKNRNPYAFLPYGVGPRNCIGVRFGKLQTRVLALRLLSKYRVEISPKTTDVVFDPTRIFVSAFSGVYLNFIPRSAKVNIE